MSFSFSSKPFRILVAVAGGALVLIITAIIMVNFDNGNVIGEVTTPTEEDDGTPAPTEDDTILTDAGGSRTPESLYNIVFIPPDDVVIINTLTGQMIDEETITIDGDFVEFTDNGNHYRLPLTNTGNSTDATTSTGGATPPTGNVTSGPDSMGGTTGSGNSTTPQGTTATTPPAQPVVISLNGTNITVSGDTQNAVDVNTNNRTARITKPGEYTITGTLSDGQIIIDSPRHVKIILQNVNITCRTGPAIRTTRQPGPTLEEPDAQPENPPRTFEIYNAPGTTNRLTDGRPEQPDYLEPEDEDSRDAALFSRITLTISGSGHLIVKGGYAHGIHCRESLRISGAKVTVESTPSIGIRSKRDTTISGSSNVTITSQGKGIRTAGNNFGSVNIIDSTVKITSPKDAIDSTVNITVRNSQIDFTVDGGWQSGSTTGISKRGFRAGGNLTITGGNIKINSGESAIEVGGGVTINNNATVNLSTARRGIRCELMLLIENSSVTIEISSVGLTAGALNMRNSTINVHATANPVSPSIPPDLIGRDGGELITSMCGITCPHLAR